MSIAIKIFRGASWLAFFKLISQIFSWITTIFVARILLPDDYGLLEMASMVVGYAMLFNELGLGSAIIQKQNPSKKELSSVFWIIVIFSFLLTIGCFAFSYINAIIFSEPRLIPLTKALSIIFFLSGLQIIPLNLLKKDLYFKKLGFIQMTGALVSCASMLIIVNMGGGVWTLLCGIIIQKITVLILLFIYVKWRPIFHFNFREAASYLNFGLKIAFARSLFYINERSDRFFAGRIWTPSLLGYYSFALQLAQVPTEKIVVLINQVSFPAFAKLQNDKKAFNELYLKIISISCTIVMPIFIGWHLVAEETIKVLLNEKWYPIIPIFKLLLLAQIITALNAPNGLVHNARNKPHLNIYYNVLMALALPISFYFAAKHGFEAIIIPWFTTYLSISVFWILFTLKSLGISFLSFFKVISIPAAGCLFMTACILLFDCIIIYVFEEKFNLSLNLALKIIIGIIAYTCFNLIFNKQIIFSIKNIFRPAQVKNIS